MSEPQRTPTWNTFDLWRPICRPERALHGCGDNGTLQSSRPGTLSLAGSSRERVQSPDHCLPANAAGAPEHVA